MKRAITSSALLLISLLALCSCVSPDDSGPTIQVEIPRVKSISRSLTSVSEMSLAPTAPYAPADVSGFDCIFINVVGPGIGNWEANSSEVGLGRNFSYIGLYSRLVSTSAGGTVTLKVKKGAQRYVQVIGVVSRIGCPASVTSSQLNSFTSFPGMFIIGSKQKDIYKTETLSINSQYSVATAADVRASEDEPWPEIDDTAPTAGGGGNLTLDKLSDTSVEVTWAKATDDGTLQEQLEYKLVRATDPATIDSISKVEALTGPGVIVNWTADVDVGTATGLDSALTYTFALLVKDGSGNKALYQANSIPMTCTCGAGEYPSGGSCVPAEVGYWAASCVRTACANTIPANSSYSGTGTATSTCNWSCNTGYVVNAAGTECVPAGTSAVGCAANEIITGVSAYLDPYIMAIGARCKTYSSGKPTGASKNGTFYGTGTLTARDCASKDAMVSEIAFSNSATGTKGIKFKCRDVNTGSETWTTIGDITDGTTSVSCTPPAYFNTFYVGNDIADIVGPFSTNKICR